MENKESMENQMVSEGLNQIIKEYVLKLYKFSKNNKDITMVNPITEKDYKTIRRSVRCNLTKDGGYFSVTDEQLKAHLIQLGGELKLNN
jgi:hypothetical protein